MSSDDDQRESNWEFYLKKIQSLVVLFVGIYASILGIISFNSDIKSLFTIPSKVTKIEEKIDVITKNLEKTQAQTNAEIQSISELANKAHQKTFDENGYTKIKIRKASSEKEMPDKNSIYYDIGSKFFNELKEDGGLQKFKVILKNDDNLFSPEIMIKIRGKTKKTDSDVETGITFQVSQSVFTALGGSSSSAYLEIKAKIIPVNQ